MKLKNNFSWSLSRYNLFNFCERAYYFHYYGSWNGWDAYASPEAKDAYRLKHLVSKEQCPNILLKKALLEAITNNPQDLTSKKFIYIITKKLSSVIRSLYSENWKNDPKRICIKEAYYNEDTLDEIISSSKSTLKQKVDLLQSSKLFSKLSKLPYSAFSDTSRPLSFKLNDILVWCSPDLIWNFKGKKHFLSLDNKGNWPFKAGINMLYAEQTWRYQHKDIIHHTLFEDEASYYSVYGFRSPKEIRNIITKSSKEMQSRLTFSQKAYIENFPKTNNLEKCKTCKFKEICKGQRAKG